MNEIIFIVKESPEGGYEGRALRYSIFVEGYTYNEINENIRDAVYCHFEVHLIQYHSYAGSQIGLRITY